MPARFEVYNPDGSIHLSLGSRTCRLVTVRDIGTSTSGTVNVTGMGSGEIVAGVILGTKGKRVPTITKTGSSVSWDYGSVPVSERDTNASLSIMLL